MRRLTTALIVAATLSQSLTAFADCPPGAWFCPGDEAAPGQPAPDQAPPPPEADTLPPPPPPVVVEEPLSEPEDDPEPAARPAPAPRVHTRRDRPPVVIYQPAPSASPPPQIIIIAPGRTAVVRRAPPRVRVVRPAAPQAATVRLAAPAPAKRRWHSEWGFNLRLEGLSMGGGPDKQGRSGPSSDAGMGGFGLSLRYRPVPAFAFDAGFDVIGGKDWNGFDRVEVPFSLNGMVFVNPRSRAQFYFLGGVHWSSATVQSENPDPRLSPSADSTGYKAEYSYFGAQGGIGLELRVSRSFALNIDAVGFIRKRTDDNQAQPEFIDANTGATTNVSGGGLFRGGMTFWW